MDFYNIYFDRIKSQRPKLLDSSIKIYLLNIKKLSKELFKSTKPSINYLKDTESVINYLENIENLASRKTLTTSIIVLLKTSEDTEALNVYTKKYAMFHKTLSVKQNEKYLDNEKTLKEETNWITGKEINDAVEKLKWTEYSPKEKGTPRQFLDKAQQHLVLSLYTLLPPVRNDHALVRITTDSSFDEKVKTPQELQFNYINLSTCKLILCNYKTFKFYGEKIITIPIELIEIIKKFENLKKQLFKVDHNFLLLNTTNLKKMEKNSLTKYLNKIFHPKKVSTTILRKVYLSEKYPINHSTRNRMLDADCMGHDINTASRIYTKILN